MMDLISFLPRITHTNTPTQREVHNLFITLSATTKGTLFTMHANRMKGVWEKPCVFLGVRGRTRSSVYACLFFFPFFPFFFFFFLFLVPAIFLLVVGRNRELFFLFFFWGEGCCGHFFTSSGVLMLMKGRWNLPPEGLLAKSPSSANRSTGAFGSTVTGTRYQ